MVIVPVAKKSNVQVLFLEHAYIITSCSCSDLDDDEDGKEIRTRKISVERWKRGIFYVYTLLF